MARVLEQSCNCKIKDHGEIGWVDDVPHCPECDEPFQHSVDGYDELDGKVRLLEF